MGTALDRLVDRLARLVAARIEARLRPPKPRKPCPKWAARYILKLVARDQRGPKVKPKARPLYLKVRSANAKLAPVKRRPRKGGGFSLQPVGVGVDAVYLPVSKTCPDTCPAKGNGCFAQDQMVTRKLERDCAAKSPADIMTEAIGEIAQARPPEGRWLRWAASGDVRHAEDARRVGEAVAGSYGPRAWGYTHTWQSIPRITWGSMSVLASVDRPEEADEAAALGYAPAIVAEHPNGPKAFTLPGSKDWRWIPCLQESLGRTCVECRLCWHGDLLRDRKIGIAFAPHGQRKALLVDALNEIRQQPLVQIRFKKAA